MAQQHTHDDIRAKAHYKRVMAVDPGMKRIGIALCDALHITVSPLEVLAMDTHAEETIVHLARQNDVAVIVMGIPERSTPSAMTLFAEEFALRLEMLLIEKNSSIAVVRFDESFSTRHAFQAMHSVGMKKKKRETKGTKDMIAACVILQHFLEEYQL